LNGGVALKKVIALAIILAVFSGTAMPMYAKTVNQLKKDQSNLTGEAKEAKQALNDTQNQQKTVFSEIDNLDKNIANVEQELDNINNQITQTQQNLKLTQQELEQAKIRKDKQDETLKKRIKYLYENGSIGYLDVLLNVTDFSDFLNRMEYINDIITYDNEVFVEMKKTQETIKIKVTKIELDKKNMELLAKDQTNKKHGLEETKSQKAQALEKLKTDETQYSKKLKEIEEDNAEIERLIKKAQQDEAKKAATSATSAKATQYTGGKMMWPVTGYYSLSSTFGYRTSPLSGRQELHSGIDIPAPQGNAVHAAADGVIVTATYLRSYGNAVIINHGGAINTVYGHNSKLLVSAGQTVKKGDVIAEVGSTGDSTGNHCHFEVRVNGSATNPISYLTK
jgi:murein DD-endopeptidase MepM/ murein hydrolase activator NlpD